MVKKASQRGNTSGTLYYGITFAKYKLNKDETVERLKIATEKDSSTTAPCGSIVNYVQLTHYQMQKENRVPFKALLGGRVGRTSKGLCIFIHSA